MEHLKIPRLLTAACAGLALWATGAAASASTLLNEGPQVSSEGVVFDLVAGSQALTLTSITFGPLGVPGTFGDSGSYSLYGRDGTWVGSSDCFTQNCVPAGWNLLATYVPPPGPPTNTFVLDWALAAGSTHGLYITGLSHATVAIAQTSASNSDLTATTGAEWTASIPFDANHPRTPGSYSLWGAFNYTLNPTAGVPEPSVWAMMLIGFGALGAAARGSPRRLQPV